MANKKSEETEVIKNEEVKEEKSEKKAKKSKDAQLIEKKDEEIKELNDKYLRLLAEYDNFKKRTVKEKEAIYTDAFMLSLTNLLPVIDNLERGLDAIEDKESGIYKGMEMILKQTQEIFEKMGVTVIEAVGKEFDPNIHNAVMHIEDETLGENIIAEEFQKGYMYKEKVLRYSMVKVAN
ncbi:MAG: nucleotide exchange factor GrpE [Ruminococcaceae bacterium]|nr:nucleotide exchange factor GrpE [Oscillospiraceae bacterium]